MKAQDFTADRSSSGEAEGQGPAEEEDGQRGCALNEPRENLEAQMLSQEGA